MQTSEDKANLRELAALTVELMVARRREKRYLIEDKTKLIACTAHDLLTPLSGVQMSLSLIKANEDGVDKMPEHQLELIETARNCSEVMSRICHDTIETFRGDIIRYKQNSMNRELGFNLSHDPQLNRIDDNQNRSNHKLGFKPINIASFVRNITLVMEPYPKKVSIYVTIDPALPKDFISHDLKVFRSVINYLTNACKHTEAGCVHLRILMKENEESHVSGLKKKERQNPKNDRRKIVFEVEDTGKGIQETQYSSLFRPFRDDMNDSNQELIEESGANILEETPGLGLYSVATNIGSLGGLYGYRPRDTFEYKSNFDSDGSCPLTTGSIFWFSIPLVEPEHTSGRGIPETVASEVEKINTSTGCVTVCDKLPAGATCVTIDAPIKETFSQEGVTKNFKSASKKYSGPVKITNKTPLAFTLTTAAISRKIVVKAKRLCGGRLSSNETVVSLRTKAKSTKSSKSVNKLSKKVITSKRSKNDETVSLSLEEVMEGHDHDDDDEVDKYGSSLSSYRSTLNMSSQALNLKSHANSRRSMTNGSSGTNNSKSLVVGYCVEHRNAFSSMEFGSGTNDANNVWFESSSANGNVTSFQKKLQILNSTSPKTRERLIVSPPVGQHANDFKNDRVDMLVKELESSFKHQNDENTPKSPLSCKPKLCDQQLKTKYTHPQTKTKSTDPGTKRESNTKNEHELGVNPVDKSEVDVKSNFSLNARRKRCALIIDDSLVIRKTMNRALTMMGLDVEVAINGLEGLQKLQTKIFDVVFCDFLMPVMDGLDCVQQYRSWEAETVTHGIHQHIIGISAHANPRDVDRGLEVGMNSFMSKPVQLRALKELVQKSERLVKLSKQLDDLDSEQKHIEATKHSIYKLVGVPTCPSEKESIFLPKSAFKKVFKSRGSEGSIEFVEKHAEVDPAREDDEAEEPTPTVTNLKMSHGFVHKPTCLIAEDSTTIARVLIRAIESKGWKAVLAHDGLQALELLKQRNWDAVFMDDQMPNMSGTECMEQFRLWERSNRIARQRNVVFMSGNYIPPLDADSCQSICSPSYSQQLFDLAVPKPVQLRFLYNVLEISSRGTENTSRDILVR